MIATHHSESDGYCFAKPRFWDSVIPAQAGIQIATLDFRLRGNDKQTLFSVLTQHYFSLMRQGAELQPSAVKTARRYSRFSRAMFETEISAGQAASHSEVLVQAPKPSLSI